MNPFFSWIPLPHRIRRNRALKQKAPQRRPPNRVLPPFLRKHGRPVAQGHSHCLAFDLLRLLSHRTSNRHVRNRRVLFHQLEQRLGLRFGEACHHRMHLRLFLAQLFVLEPLIAPTKGLCQLCKEFLVLGLYPFKWLDHTAEFVLVRHVKVCQPRPGIVPSEDEQQLDNMEVRKPDEQRRRQPRFVCCFQRLQVLHTLERATARRHCAAACRKRL